VHLDTQLVVLIHLDYFLLECGPGPEKVRADKLTGNGNFLVVWVVIREFFGRGTLEAKHLVEKLRETPSTLCLSDHFVIVEHLDLIEEEVLEAVRNIGLRFLNKDETFLHPTIMCQGFHNIFFEFLGVLSELRLVLQHKLRQVEINELQHALVHGL